MSVRLASVDSLMLHDAALIESDFTYLSDIDWQTITLTGRDRSYVIKALKHGEIVLLSDSPRLPLFSLSRNGPIVNSVYGEDIDAQVLTRLTKRFANTSDSGSQSNSNVWQPAPQLSYIADTSRVQETPPSPPPILISDNFSKSPQRLELELCYNDNEKTFASHVPYTVIFSDPNRTVIQGVLNSKGWAMVEGGPNYPAQVIFGDEAEKVEAEAAITIQYQQLDQALDDTANHIAQQALAAKETKRVALTESFKQAVDDKIAELNAQSEAFDNLSFLSQSWQIAQATQNGATRGVTEYLPDLGEFGELMEAADIDIFMLLEAISTGKAQREARKNYQKELIEKYREKFRKSREYLGQEALDKARELAEQDMKTLNALHSPDLYAGGKDEISGFGDASVNQSIGSQWKTKGDADLTRVQLMDREAQKALAQLGPNAHMNITLHRCH